MKKTCIIITLCATILLYGKEAYATFDPMATVESALELKDELVTQVQELQKMKLDMEKRLKQGYALATSCFKNPVKCGLQTISSLSNDDGFETIKFFPMMPGTDLIYKDLTKMSSESVSKEIRASYIYHTGPRSLENLRENRDNINSVVADQSALLFAKGATIKTRLLKEDSADIYEDPSKNNQVDSIEYLQAKLDINDQVRLARILEIKAYILHAQSTSELTQQSIKEDEDK
jgi:hypothetical protein